MKKRIAVLLHKAQREHDLRDYLISHLAQIWRDDDLEVVFLSGPNHFVPADLIIVHIDLSVVPDEYLGLARQYPVTLNCAVTDIRKSMISTQRVTTTGDYGGKVLVKSNLNYGGVPDRKLARLTEGKGRWRRLLTKLDGRLAQFDGRLSYRIYDRVERVPARFFATDDFIVEKFVPEIEDGKYHVRQFEFLGDRFTCFRLASTHPIIRSRTASEAEEVEPHRALFEIRRRLNLDYGKLDYVIHDDQPVLLDVEKTNVVRAFCTDKELIAKRRHHWAQGIYAYLR
ncbi:MAG TPA: hypothetical protein VMR97_00645 [Acidimicrobiales bacterium]|nr:hypothetical protein [Acidimicrobiales bacterium]